ncbi:MAG TPA: hypothetical protein EYP71_06795 [Dehalococcoidia bacterium]|nr:hypothetical protein [Dehalococcoidia bacterium]
MRSLLWLAALLWALIVLTPITSTSAQADFKVSDLNISPQSAQEGDTITISANVTNTGEKGTYAIQLIINGEIKETKELTLDAGASELVTFTITAGSPGDYFVELGNSSGSFSVAGSFWSIFPTWVWIAIGIIVGILIILIIVLAATPPRKKQPEAATEGAVTRQWTPSDREPAVSPPIPTSGPGPAIPPTGYQPTMPPSPPTGAPTPRAYPTPSQLQTPEQFQAPMPAQVPHPTYAPRPLFSVSNLTIMPNQAKAGQPVTISAIVSNNGSEAGRYSVILRINGLVENIIELALPPGTSQPATFTVVKDEGGEYYAEVDGLGGAFTIIPLVPANFTVSNLTIVPERIKQGENIAISATVTNTGELEGSYSLVLKLKGAIESVEELTLGPGESRRVSFNLTKNIPGFYNVELDGLTGRFVVEMEWQG